MRRRSPKVYTGPLGGTWDADEWARLSPDAHDVYRALADAARPLDVSGVPFRAQVQLSMSEIAERAGLRPYDAYAARRELEQAGAVRVLWTWAGVGQAEANVYGIRPGRRLHAVPEAR